jgi:hypothetical protein
VWGCGGVGCVGDVGGVGCVGAWGVWGRGGVGVVGVWGHSLRSTFHRLHLLRLWTPTILAKVGVLTIMLTAWSAKFKSVWYVLLRPLRPELFLPTALRDFWPCNNFVSLLLL